MVSRFLFSVVWNFLLPVLGSWFLIDYLFYLFFGWPFGPGFTMGVIDNGIVR